MKRRAEVPEAAQAAYGRAIEEKLFEGIDEPFYLRRKKELLGDPPQNVLIHFYNLRGKEVKSELVCLKTGRLLCAWYYDCRRGKFYYMSVQYTEGDNAFAELERREVCPAGKAGRYSRMYSTVRFDEICKGEHDEKSEKYY